MPDNESNGNQRVTNAEIKKDIANLSGKMEKAEATTKDWRDRMDARLRAVEIALAAHTAIEKTKPIKNDNDDPDDNADAKGLVTWTWIRDKLVQPILIMFVAWFLLTILPRLIVITGP